jgi:hypothetical protein
VWDWPVLDPQAVKADLALRLPNPQLVSRDCSVFQIIEQMTSKRIVWIPPLSEDEASRARSVSYRDACEGKDMTASNIGMLLQGYLTSSSEFGFHEGSQLSGDEQNINVAIFLRDRILIIAVPEGYSAAHAEQAHH